MMKGTASQGEVPPVGLADKSKDAASTPMRAKVKNTFLHFEDEDGDMQLGAEDGPLSRSMPIGAFNRALEVERGDAAGAEATTPAPTSQVAEHPKTSSGKKPSVKIAISPEEYKEAIGHRTSHNDQSCAEDFTDEVPAFPSTPIYGGGTPKCATSAPTPLRLE